MSSLVPLGSSALTSEMWLGHCTAQTACIHIQKILGFPQWKQCTASMPHPLQFPKNPPSSLSKRSIPLQLGFLWLLVYEEADGSLFVLTLSLWKSMQKCSPLSFLHTNTTGLPLGLWLGQLAPTSNIFVMCAWTSSSMGRRILWKHSLKGSLSTTLISCFTRLVQPNSPGSKKKKSWYLANTAWVATWFPLGHPSKAR